MAEATISEMRRDWMLPMKCQQASGNAADFGTIWSGRFSPKSRAPPSIASATPSGPTVFDTATRSTSSGARPAATAASATSAATF